MLAGLMVHFRAGVIHNRRSALRPAVATRANSEAVFPWV